MPDPSPDAVAFFVETRLREALERDGGIDAFIAMLAVATERRDPPREAVRKALAHWCLEVLGVDAEKSR